jgi:hypothetical protein
MLLESSLLAPVMAESQDSHPLRSADWLHEKPDDSQRSSGIA